MAKLPSKTAATEPVSIPENEPADVATEPAAEEQRAEAKATKTAPKKAAKGTPRAGVRLAVPTIVDEKINICYYGPEGTGKTTDAAHMAKLGKIVYVNAESGLIARRLRKLGVPIENIVLWPDPDSGEVITYDGLENLFWHIKGELLDDPASWAGVVFDSATEIMSSVLDQVRERAIEKAERAGKERDPFFTDLADYGTMTSMMRSLLKKFRDLPCHFALTALERRDTDDDGAVIYGPAVTPALISDIAGYVGIVVHTEVKEHNGETTYSGRTAPGTKYRAKDRFGVLPKLMAVPTFDRINEYVNERLDAETDPEQKLARERVAAAREAEEARKAAGVKKSTNKGDDE